MTHASDLLILWDSYQAEHARLRSALAKALSDENLTIPTNPTSEQLRSQLNTLNEKMALIENQVNEALRIDNALRIEAERLEAERLARLEAERLAQLTATEREAERIRKLTDEIKSLQDGYIEQARLRSAWSAFEFSQWQQKYFANIEYLKSQLPKVTWIQPVIDIVEGTVEEINQVGKGLSTNQKIGIVGGIAAAITTGIVIYSKKKK